MGYKTLDSFDFKGKRVLVRVDINSEIRNGKVVLSERIKQSATTINELIKKKAKVVVIAHQGRPGSKDFISLRQHAALLNKFVKIKFIDDIIGKKALTAIQNLKEGEAILLQNIRFSKEELNPGKNNRLVGTLAPLFDYYVNDAFSVSHREQSSITEFPKHLKSCIGRLMEHELKNLKKIRIKDCLFVLGGAKLDDVLLLRNKKILTTGILGNLCLIAEGYSLGKNNAIKNNFRDAYKEVQKNITHIGAPIDVAIDSKGRKEIAVTELPTNHDILDIGTQTATGYAKEIMHAESIFLKGTAGVCEKKGFEKGTRILLEAMAKTKAFTVISGGNTTTAMHRFGINKKNINYISLSGGALVHYLAGKKLPGLEALKNSI